MIAYCLLKRRGEADGNSIVTGLTSVLDLDLNARA